MLRETFGEESVLTYVEPGVTVHGTGIGQWLHKQRQHTIWAGLMGGQRKHLETIVSRRRRNSRCR